MKKVVRLTESDLNRIVKRVLNEQSTPPLKTSMGGSSVLGKFGLGGDIDYNRIERLTNPKEIAQVILKGLCFNEKGMRSFACNDQEALVEAAFMSFLNYYKKTKSSYYELYKPVEEIINKIFGRNDPLIYIIRDYMDINKKYHKMSIQDQYEIFQEGEV